MAEFQQELPEDVNVETVTFIAYQDGRPTEVVMAGTSDDNVRHLALPPVSEAILADFLRELNEIGYVDPAAD